MRYESYFVLVKLQRIKVRVIFVIALTLLFVAAAAEDFWLKMSFFS